MAEGGGEPKYDMMTRGRGGSGYPLKMMTSFMNSPLYVVIARSVKNNLVKLKIYLTSASARQS